MSEINLFTIENGVAKLESKNVAFERELQVLIEKNMPAFFGVTFLKSEFPITNGRMDSLGIDENNCPVIFEYKRSVNENVINQGLFYLDWLLDHRADFKLLVMEHLGSAAADGIDWSMPCVICIASDFTKFDLHAVNQMQRNIKLVRYKKYGNDLLLFEHLNAPQVQALPDEDKSTIKPNGKQDLHPNRNFAYCYKSAPQSMKDIFDNIRDYILSLGDDVSENQLKLYVAFKKVKNFVCAEIYNQTVLLQLRLDPSRVELTPGFIEDVSKKGHWGTGDIQITLRSISDYEKIRGLIDRAYNEN
jgi:predicted transport protein